MPSRCFKLVTITAKGLLTVLAIVGQGENMKIKIKKGSKKFTFGEHLKCMPGTGSVVTYIVIHRYKYSVPTIQKNLLLIIDLEEKKKRKKKKEVTQCKYNIKR